MPLLLAHFGKEGVPETVIPKISQETLAEMVGTTRSRASFFMNRFRKLGFIHYNGGLQVHSSLLMLFSMTSFRNPNLILGRRLWRCRRNRNRLRRTKSTKYRR